MAQSFDYTFGNMSRLGLDNCNLTQDMIQNMNACNYMTQNYFGSDCSMMIPRELAISQPGMMYNGGYGSGAGGCNVDDSSQLLIGSIQTHPRCRLDLFHRPFATVPFLGRGSVNTVIESQIQQGEQMTNKKTTNLLSETNTLPYQLPYHSPPPPTTHSYIHTTNIPTRELTRDNHYHL